MDSNGLSILLKPDRSMTAVTFNVTYRVGSRNEVTGTTGAAHFLEHLMFKGSKNYNDAAGNSVKQYLEHCGAEYTASTATDRTNYLATLDESALEGYIAIEADRMRNLWLYDADRNAEMTVVRNEYEIRKNNPDNLLEEAVVAAAYEALPYHHPPIGWKSDIEHVSIEQLRAFYDTFYWPNNATLVIVGRFEPERVLGLIKKYYGSYSPSPHAIPEIYTQEPEQYGARRIEVRQPGNVAAVLIAHKVPNARDVDAAPLEVLDAVLSKGQTSRLYRALVDKGLATKVNARTTGKRDLSLHLIFVSVVPGIEPAFVERTLLSELDRVKREGVTPAELKTATRQLRADITLRRDNSIRIVWELNKWIAVGDWTLYVTFPDLLAGVTLADVQRVARRYFTEDQSTTGWFVPITASRRGSPLN